MYIDYPEMTLTRFRKRFENYKYLEDNPFEAEGVDIDSDGKRFIK